MIAHLVVVCPFVIVVPEGGEYTTYGYEDSGYTVVARPPIVVTDAPLPHDLPTVIEIGGKPGFLANALRFEFHKKSFERGKNAEYDPPLDVLQRTVTGFLGRVRFVTRAPQIQLLSIEGGTTWRLEYRNDDGTELAEEPGLCRARIGRFFRWSSVALTPTIWEQIHQLEPDWASPVWDDILLDAFHALPKIGTAVVLAATALEVFVATILDQLAADSALPSEIWTWINDRENWLKDPSTEEQFDALLRHFSGHSLKEESKLWQAFKELRTARNTFVHQGCPMIAKTPITEARAQELVSAAGQITRVVRGWLPAKHQWPVFETPETLKVMFPILGPGSTQPASPAGAD